MSIARMPDVTAGEGLTTGSPVIVQAGPRGSSGDNEDVTVGQLAGYIDDPLPRGPRDAALEGSAGTGVLDVQSPVPARVAPAHAPAKAGRMCVCGHAKQAHQHYRAGTDCALCTCPRLRRSFVRRLFSRVG